MSAQIREDRSFNKVLVLPSHPDSIQKVEEFIDEIRQALDVREDVYGNIMVAITEAVNNGIHHGNKLDPNRNVVLHCETTSLFRLKVEVKDQGAGFDPDSLGDPTSLENLEKPGGRGVFLMRALADEISFSDEGRCVQMIFNI